MMLEQSHTVDHRTSSDKNELLMCNFKKVVALVIRLFLLFFMSL